MSVQANEQDIFFDTAVFEARFDDAYRYYDRCGETISRIRALDGNWVPSRIDPQTGVLLNKDLGLRLAFDDSRMNIGRISNEWAPASTGSEFARTLGQSAETLYSLVTETLQIPNTRRVGARFDFLAKADSMEDAERFLSAGLQSDYSRRLESELSGTLYEASASYRIDENETGIRRTIQIQKVTKMAPSQPGMTGLPGDTGESAVQVDIDSYTRPDSGHFEGLSDFIQRSFAKSKTLAYRMFHELRSRQK